MASPVKLNFKVYQGSTFKEVLRRETSTKVYVPITNITKAAPAVITAAGHNIPVGWRTKITNVGGMVEINSDETYHIVTATTADTVTINAINSLGFKNYTTGGVLEYNQPFNLTDVTARMQIRGKITDPTVIEELTTENGGIVIDNTAKTIMIVIAAENTALYDFNSAVYSMELISDGEVIPFITGTLTLEREVTR